MGTVKKMIVDKTAYRANDIRGIADETHPNFQFSDDFFCTLTALAYVELLRKHRRKEPQERTVVIGKDVRNSSPRLKAAFAEALVSRGVHVIDIAPAEKVSSTPLMYFATWLFDADGGVEVTGSHLDKEWNGFKLCIGSEYRKFRDARRWEGFMRYCCLKFWCVYTHAKCFFHLRKQFNTYTQTFSKLYIRLLHI